MVVEIFLQNKGLTLQVFFIENTGQELFFKFMEVFQILL